MSAEDRIILRLEKLVDKLQKAVDELDSRVAEIEKSRKLEVRGNA